MFDLVCLSLGGGVQSTAMSLMAADGYFGDQPDVAYFADTGWEPSNVYQTVEAVRGRVPWPVETVSNGRSLKEDVYNGVAANGNDFTPIPLFTSSGGMNTRQCTNQYKIAPIQKAVRERLGCEEGERVKPGTAVEQWMGISTDEVARAKPIRLKYVTTRFPLVERNLSRRDCAAYLAERHPDIPVGKSACKGCPFHDRAAWRRLAVGDPEGFAETVKIDKALREPWHNEVRNRNTLSFLHSARVPLDEAVAMDASTDSLFGDGAAEELSCDSGHCFL